MNCRECQKTCNATHFSRIGLVIVFLFAQTGCKLPEDDLGIIRAVWNEFPWWSVVWRLVVWTMLGAMVGVLVACFGFRLLRRRGAYRYPGRAGRWARAVIFILTLVMIVPILGYAGLAEGVYRAGEAAIRHSVIGKEWLPKIGAECADVIVYLDAVLEQEDLPDWDRIHEQKRAVNVPRFLERLNRLQEGVGEKITNKAKEKLFEENPDWKGGSAEVVIDWTLPTLIQYLVKRKVKGKLAEHGADDFLNEMLAEAQKDGDDLLTHAELTEFLTDRVLIPMLVYPLRQWAAGTQWGMAGATLLVFAVPVVLLWLARAILLWWKRRQVRRLCVDKL